MKKTLSVILSLMLCVSFAWCRAASGESAGDVIKIGLYTPLTGVSALVGTQLKMGVDLAAEQLTASGGNNGRQYNVIAYDDQFNAETAVKVVTRLVQTDKVNAIIGSMSSANILATADIVDKARVLEIGCGTSPTWTNAGYDYVFRGTQNAASFNSGIVELMTRMGVTRLGTMISSTEYATTGWAEVKQQLEGHDIDIVIETSYMAGDTDFTGQITRLLNANLDGIMLYGGTEDFGIECKQLRQMGYEGYIYGPETFSSPDVREVAGDAANGVLFACGYVIPDVIDDATSEAEKAFLKAFVEKYGELPASDTAYRGYDSMMLLARVFETAKSTEGPDLREALLNVDYTGIAGKFDYSDGSGDGLKGCNLYAIVDGKNVPFDVFLKTIGK